MIIFPTWLYGTQWQHNSVKRLKRKLLWLFGATLVTIIIIISIGVVMCMSSWCGFIFQTHTYTSHLLSQSQSITRTHSHTFLSRIFPFHWPSFCWIEKNAKRKGEKKSFGIGTICDLISFVWSTTCQFRIRSSAVNRKFTFAFAYFHSSKVSTNDLQRRRRRMCVCVNDRSTIVYRETYDAIY